MKFTFLLLLMIHLTAFSLSAQLFGFSPFAEKSISITAGVSFANVTEKTEGLSATSNHKTGFTAGLVTNATISENFIFQPAINFVQKGYKIKDVDGTETVNLNYLEIPLNLVYSTKRNEGFFIGAGPSIAYGISGTDKVKYTDGSMPDYSEKIKFGVGRGALKSFDFGVNAIAGYRLPNGFMILANYNLGLSKINTADGSGNRANFNNKYFSLKIGYAISKKEK